MNAADYLYEQLMEAHERIRELEESLKNLELHYQLTNIEPVVKPKRGRPRKEAKK
jgi:hypothetical protein